VKGKKTPYLNTQSRMGVHIDEPSSFLKKDIQTQTMIRKHQIFICGLAMPKSRV
jgi:hypothetical protein